MILGTGLQTIRSRCDDFLKWGILKSSPSTDSVSSWKAAFRSACRMKTGRIQRHHSLKQCRYKRSRNLQERPGEPAAGSAHSRHGSSEPKSEESWIAGIKPDFPPCFPVCRQHASAIQSSDWQLIVDSIPGNMQGFCNWNSLMFSYSYRVLILAVAPDGLRLPAESIVLQ